MKCTRNQADIAGAVIFCAVVWLASMLTVLPWDNAELRNGTIIGFVGGYLIRWAIEHITHRVRGRHETMLRY